VTSATTYGWTGGSGKQSHVLVEFNDIPASNNYTETPSATIPLSDNLTLDFNVSLSESLSLDDGTVETTGAKSQTPSATIPLSDNLTLDFNVSLSESLSLDDGTVQTSTTKSATPSAILPLSDNLTLDFNVSLADSVGLADSLTSSIITTIIRDNTQLVVNNTDEELGTINIQSGIYDTSIDYSAILNPITYEVSINNGYTVNTDVDSSIASYDVVLAIFDSTTLSGPSGWNGILNLPEFESISIPTETSSTTTTENGRETTTITETVYSEITAIDVGLNSGEVSFDNPVRIEFTGDGGDDFVAFFQRSGDSSVTIIDTICDADDLTTVNSQLDSGEECYIDDGSDLIIWTTHLTTFGTAKSSSTSITTSTTLITGRGATGVSVPGAGLIGTLPTPFHEFGTVLATDMNILTVTYDACDSNLVRILIGTDGVRPPLVKIHSSLEGIADTKLILEPEIIQKSLHEEFNIFVYEGEIPANEEFFIVEAQTQEGRVANTVSQLVDITSCKKTILYTDVIPDLTPTTDLDAPRFFDVKTRLGTDVNSSRDVTVFVDEDESLTVTGIVSSTTAPALAELRFVNTEKESLSIQKIKMGIQPTGINNSYHLEGSIPRTLMDSPSITYWIRVLNDDGLISDSSKYVIGVKPSILIEGNSQMSINEIKTEGSSLNAQVGFTNELSMPVFGYAQLKINGEIVKFTPGLVFQPELSEFSFDWELPKTGSVEYYDVQTIVNIYDSSFETQTSKMVVYPSTHSSIVSEFDELEIIVDDNDNSIARPASIYSSLPVNSQNHFVVSAPDGTCVIGKDSQCLIQDSTFNQRGYLATINLEGIVYHIRYSGSDGPLERFTITSAQPILGKWQVEIMSDDNIINDELIQTTEIKVKYRSYN